MIDSSDTPLNRRQFVALSGSLLLTPNMSWAGALKSSRGQLLAPAFFKRDGKLNNGLFRFSLDQPVSDIIPLPFQGHSVFAMGGDSSKVVVIPKYGKEMALVDLTLKKVVQTWPSRLGYFYGHGVIDSKRSVMYTTEGSYQQVRTEVIIRQLPDLKPTGRIPNMGTRSHDLSLSSDQRYLFIANGDFSKRDAEFVRYNKDLSKLKKQSSLIIFDLESRKIHRAVDYSKYGKNIGHLALDGQNRVVLAGSNFSKTRTVSSVMFYQKDSDRYVIPIKSLKDRQRSIAPRSFLTGTNSVALDERRSLAAVTHQDGFLSLWNYPEGRLIKTYTLPTPPTGVFLDGRQENFFITTAGVQKEKQTGSVYTLNVSNSPFDLSPSSWSHWGLSDNMEVYFSTHCTILV